MKISELLKFSGVDLDKVIFVRHALSDRECHEAYTDGLLEEYQAMQKPLSDNKPVFAPGSILVSFVSGSGTTAVFYGCYKVLAYSENTKEFMPKSFTSKHYFDGTGHYYTLQKLPYLDDQSEKLTIEWGGGVSSWYNYYKNGIDKEIID